MGFLDKAYDFLRPALMVPTERVIHIDVWYVGLIHRTIQLGALVYLALSFILGNTWAKSEIPQPTVNSYALPSVGYTSANRDYVAGTKTPKHCGNSSYAFSSSSNPEWFWPVSYTHLTLPTKA